MKKTLLLFLAFFSITGLTFAQQKVSMANMHKYTMASPVNVFVGYHDEHVTAEELSDLDFTKIQDSAGQMLAQYAVYTCAVVVKRKGEQHGRVIGYCAPLDEVPDDVQTQYGKMMDSVGPGLGLGDTVNIVFKLFKPAVQEAPNQVLKEDVLEAEDIYQLLDLRDESEAKEIRQTFVISSRTVVYLNRNPNGLGVVSVYPSPATEDIYIQFDLEETAAGNLALLDPQGKELEATHHDNLLKPYTFKMTEYPAGTYFVRAEIDGEFFVKKFIKQ